MIVLIFTKKNQSSLKNCDVEHFLTHEYFVIAFLHSSMKQKIETLHHPSAYCVLSACIVCFGPLHADINLNDNKNSVN